MCILSVQHLFFLEPDAYSQRVGVGGGDKGSRLYREQMNRLQTAPGSLTRSQPMGSLNSLTSSQSGHGSSLHREHLGGSTGNLKVSVSNMSYNINDPKNSPGKSHVELLLLLSSSLLLILSLLLLLLLLLLSSSFLLLLILFLILLLLFLFTYSCNVVKVLYLSVHSLKFKLKVQKNN